MSEGTRSGVNWTRANDPPTTVANVRTARVFAVPGTPSSRMWPCASKPAISCSTMCSSTDDDPLHLRYCLSQDLGGILGGQRLLIA